METIDSIKKQMQHLKNKHQQEMYVLNAKIRALQIECEHDWRKHTDISQVTETYCTRCGATK
jgi:hypothetical protein